MSFFKINLRYFTQPLSLSLALFMTRRSVALLIETSNAYARGLLDGVIDYVPPA